MALSIVIFSGPTPEKARPVFATRDPYIVATLRRIIIDRLTDEVEDDPLGRPPRQKEKADDR